jgi:cell division protein FtsQ
MSEVAGRRATIDPRIRARRIAVQRDEGRKRLRRVMIAGVAVGALAGLWGLTRTPLLDIDRIEVAGATNSGVDAVVATSTIEHGGALVTAPLDRAADRIAALPWVQTVEVTRRWPGTVVIEVVERRPVAYVPATKGVVLVDAAGRQLAGVETPPPELLRLDVAAITPAPGQSLPTRTQAVLDLAGTVPGSLAGRILALRPERDGTVSGTVRLRNDTDAHLLLGAPNQIGAKWLALATVLERTDPAGLATIDLRVPAAPALTRR